MVVCCSESSWNVLQVMVLPVVVWWWSWSNCLSGWCRWHWQKRCFSSLLGVSDYLSWLLCRYSFKVVWLFGVGELLKVCSSLGLLRWLSLHALSLGTGMHDGLALWMHVVSLFCLLWVLCGFNSCFVGTGMHDGLGMHLVWSWNGKKSVSSSCSV